MKISISCLAVVAVLAFEVSAQPVKKITIDDVVREHLFGFSVDVVEDNLLIGAIGDTTHGAYSGAVHVYGREQGQWVPSDKLVASASVARDGFGYFIAVNGNRALISGLRGDPYVFVREESGWTEEARLVLSDSTATERSTRALALSDEFAFVGEEGRVFIYRSIDGVWVLADTLRSSVPEAHQDNFGRSICVTDNTLLVGAHLDDEYGDDAGAAYVFERVGNTWIETAKLVAPDPDQADQFGRGLTCAYGDLVIHSYSGGQTYTFKKVDGQWVEQPGQMVISRVNQQGRFFERILGRRDFLFVSGTVNEDGVDWVGTLQVFEKAGDHWTHLGDIQAPDRSEGDGFGRAVALYEDEIIVGAPYQDRDPLDEVGAVYIVPLSSIRGLVQDIDDIGEVPRSTRLRQNYPNPFSSSTLIRYTLPKSEHVRLEVYDLIGRRILILKDQPQPPGHHELTMDDRSLPSGTYFYTLRAGNFVDTKMMTVVR